MLFRQETRRESGGPKRGGFTITRLLVGGRVLKTALAVTLAIFIAQQLNLERYTLAAIVAFVTVQRTFYHSLLQSLAKMGSVLLGGILGTIFGYAFGITPLGYGLVTLTAIYVCLRLRWQDHIVITTITGITIIFGGRDFALAFTAQQIFTALIGALSALTINYLFTPNHRKDVLSKITRAEAGLREAINFITREMLEPGCDDAPFKEQINDLEKTIDTALEEAKLLREEQRFIVNRETDADRYRQTLHIYKSQLNRLDEMHRLARRMPVRVPQALPLAKLFRIVKKLQFRRFCGRDDHHNLIIGLMNNLEAGFSEMELPQTREEFVSRASLFHLFQEIKRYYDRMHNTPSAIICPVQPEKTIKRRQGKQQTGENVFRPGDNAGSAGPYRGD